MRIESTDRKYLFLLQDKPTAENPLDEIGVLEHMPLEGIIKSDDRIVDGRKAYLRIGAPDRDLIVEECQDSLAFTISPDIYWCFKNYGIASADDASYRIILARSPSPDAEHHPRRIGHHI